MTDLLTQISHISLINSKTIQRKHGKQYRKSYLKPKRIEKSFREGETVITDKMERANYFNTFITNIGPSLELIVITFLIIT